MRTSIVLAFVALLALASPFQLQSGRAQGASTPEGCDTTAIATAPLQPGSPLVSDEVVLTGTTGDVLSSATFDEPAEVIPATYEDRAIIRSLGGDYGVLELSTNTVTMLEFAGAEPGEVSHRSLLFRESRGSRFRLFGDNLGRNGFLVDLETGDTVNLADLVPEPSVFITGAVSANDRWLMLSGGNRTVVIDLTTFLPGTEVNSGRQARNAHFTMDDQAVVFARDMDAAGFEIVLRELATGATRTLAPAGPWLGIRVLADDAVLAWQNEALFHVPLDGSGPRRILDASGELAPMSIDSAGRNVLVRQVLPDQTSWFLVPLDGLPATTIEALDGLQQLAPERVADWALFGSALEPLQGVPGVPYIALDLRSGVTATQLTQDATGIYIVSPSSATGGRYHLVQSVAPEIGRLWLLDAAEGTSTLIAESAGNAVGMFSPDGCFLAVSAFAALGEGRQGQVTIRDLRSGNVTATITNAVLLGWVRL